MDDWLDAARVRIAAATGADAERLVLTDLDVDALLDLARIAAHDSGARTNAPLVCFLVGVALGEDGSARLADVCGAASAASPN